MSVLLLSIRRSVRTGDEGPIMYEQANWLCYSTWPGMSRLRRSTTSSRAGLLYALCVPLVCNRRLRLLDGRDR